MNTTTITTGHTPNTSCTVAGCVMCRPSYPSYPMNTGWRCPGCSSCYAPHITKCFTCGQTWTYNTPTITFT